MKSYNVLTKGLKSILMRIAYGLQVLDSLLKHIASAFKSLHLILEAFDYDYIIVCAFNKKCISSVKCREGAPVNIRGSAS